MQRAKSFVSRYFEPIIVLVLAVGTAYAVLVAPDKLAFLNFFYIPAVFAAYFLGMRQGLLVAVAAVLMVVVYAIIDPTVFAQSHARMPALALFLWGAFLILVTYLVGSQFDAKSRAVAELKQAYDGILGLAATLIDAVDKHSEDHSARVATLAARIAVVQDLPTEQIDDIHASGLLHDVSKAGASLDALREAAEQGPRGDASLEGRGILRNVVRIVETYQENFDGSGPHGMRGEDIPVGARILAVADEYEARIAARPYGPGLSVDDALTEVHTLAGGRLDPHLVSSLVTVAESQ